MAIGEICNRDVIVTGPDTPIPDVARLMRQYHVGNVVVTEDRNGERFPVGILTDRDIVVGLVAQSVDVEVFTAGEVMTFDLTTVREDDDLLGALHLMRVHGVRRLPVINDHGGLVGILAMEDILELMAAQASDLARLVVSEQEREKVRRA